VEQARRRYPGVEFRQGEAENLPFDDESFDVVASALGMPHFADHDAFMSEAARVLRPGGRLVFASWVRPANNPFFGIVLSAIAQHGSLDVELPPGIDMFTWDDLAVCQEYLDRAGFGPGERTDVVLSIELKNGPADILRTLEEGAVRSRALLMAQTPEARTAIERELDLLLQPNKVGDRWLLEGRAFVVAANKTSPGG
jgi:SAM-dependent methyltransferase